MEARKTTTRNKGGRPRKAVKKDQLLAVKCTLYERRAIEARAKSANLSISEYLREITLTGKIDKRDKALPRVEKPVLHLSLRLAPGETLSRNQLIEIGREAAKGFGVADHQYICVLHKDTKEQHTHIAANRVGFDGKVASDSNSYKRIENDQITKAWHYLYNREGKVEKRLMDSAYFKSWKNE
jgi:Relaxase/Mobilisation nuclease domain